MPHMPVFFHTISTQDRTHANKPRNEHTNADTKAHTKAHTSTDQPIFSVAAKTDSVSRRTQHTHTISKKEGLYLVNPRSANPRMPPCPCFHMPTPSSPRRTSARNTQHCVCLAARCLLQHSAPAPPSAVGTLLSALYTLSRLRTKDPGGTYLHTLLNRSHPTLSTQPELHRRVVWDCVLHGHRGGAEGPMRGLALPTTGPPPSHSLPSSTHS